MSKLAPFLKRHRRVEIDPSIFIYELEDNPRYMRLARAVVEAIAVPDAIQAATCAHAGATGFITNDAAFKRIAIFETLQFDDLLG